MVYELVKTSRFKAGVKQARKRWLGISLLEDVIEKLRKDVPLEAKHHNHELAGKYKGIWECHIQPDWLLLYLKDDGVLVLTLVDTGTHGDLFKK